MLWGLIRFASVKDSNEHSQHRFLLRNDENCLSIIIKYHQIRTLSLLLFNGDLVIIKYLLYMFVETIKGHNNGILVHYHTSTVDFLLLT